MLTRSEVNKTIKRYKKAVENLFEGAEQIVAVAMMTENMKEIKTQITLLKRHYDYFYYRIHKRYKAKFDDYFTRSFLTRDELMEISKTITKHRTEYPKYAQILEDRIDNLIQKKYSCFRLFCCDIFHMQSNNQPSQSPYQKFYFN